MTRKRNFSQIRILGKSKCCASLRLSSYLDRKIRRNAQERRLKLTRTIRGPPTGLIAVAVHSRFPERVNYGHVRVGAFPGPSPRPPPLRLPCNLLSFVQSTNPTFMAGKEVGSLQISSWCSFVRTSPEEGRE